MTYPSGNEFEGEWENDKKNGKGIMLWHTKGEKYDGQWKENLQNGFGVHIWLENPSDGKFLRNRYEGFWNSGLRDGIGAFYYANGSVYLGEWSKNEKNGFALFTDESGEIHQGNFLHDKLISDPLQDEMKQESKKDNSPGLKKVKKLGDSKMNLTHYSETTNKFLCLFRKKEIDANPFLNLIDINDVKNFVTDQKDIDEVYTVLLRHNAAMKKIYRQFSHIDDVYEDENLMCMNISKVIHLFKEARLFSPRVSLVWLMRSFKESSKFLFETTQNFEIMEILINLLKDQHSIQWSPISFKEMDQLLWKNSLRFLEGSQDVDFKIQIKEVVSLKKPILFRQFVEILLRYAFLQSYPKQPLSKAINHLIVEKLTKYLEEKKKKRESLGTGPPIEEDFVNEYLMYFEEKYLLHFNKLIQNYSDISWKNVGEYHILSITVRRILKLFNDSEFVTSEIEKNLFLSSVERYHDPDESVGFTDLKIRIAEKDAKQKLKRNIKLHNLYNKELASIEFLENVVHFLAKKVNFSKLGKSEKIRFQDYPQRS